MSGSGKHVERGNVSKMSSSPRGVVLIKHVFVLFRRERRDSEC